jgi:hypothetical protein
MISRRAARLIVERAINRNAEVPRRYVFDELTIERPWGWVMYHGTAPAADDLHRANPPFLINRVTGELIAAGQTWPIEKYIEDYETRLLTAAGAGSALTARS